MGESPDAGKLQGWPVSPTGVGVPRFRSPPPGVFQPRDADHESAIPT